MWIKFLLTGQKRKLNSSNINYQLQFNINLTMKIEHYKGLFKLSIKFGYTVYHCQNDSHVSVTLISHDQVTYSLVQGYIVMKQRLLTLA